MTPPFVSPFTRLMIALPPRFATLLPACFGFALTLTCQAVEDAERRPNILLFLVDDLGWSDLGCYGETWMETPRIDAFASESVRFTDFYANGAVCSPSRAAIQSGQYPTRFQLTAHIPGHFRPFEKITEPPNAMALPEEILTAGEALLSIGYRTGYFGKWHLGSGPGQTPADQGYETVVETRGSHFAPDFRTFPDPDPSLSPGTYLTDYLTDRTIDFIRKHRESEFFVTCAHYAVHIPLQARRELIAKYEGKAKSDPDDVTHPVYAAMVEHVDQSLGRILDELEALGLAGETIVIFTSDNGGLRSRYDGQGYVVTSNAPLRDEKGSLYEGGIRVPTIIRWPGVAVPGAVCHEPAASIDFYPTLLEAAVAFGPPGLTLDGQSLIPLLTEPAGPLQRDALYWHYPHYHHSRPASAIRTHNWKLIHFWDDGGTELYDLETDLSESTDLAAEHPALVQRLLRDLTIWREDSGALVPYWNERHNPARAHEWWNKMTLEPLDLAATREAIRTLPFDGPRGSAAAPGTPSAEVEPVR